MSGRLPIHVNQQNYAEWGWTGAPVHMNMTMLPQKLKQGANYSTHHIGKWHLGLASPKFTPVNRGFDTSLVNLLSQELGCRYSFLSPHSSCSGISQRF